ncbi:MAG: heat shock protein DnaJ domain protein, partial [Bacilli bacterium]|nr:heat shock protein DnaJ domain protein [Bacilli bacterium]
YNEARFGTNIRKKERSEKIEYFWNHHRLKVIASVIAIAVVVMVYNIVINNIKLANLPKPAIEIMMYGNYYGANDPDLEKAILTKYADWKRIKAIINYLPGQSSGAADPAYVQKSFVILATEHPDIYILDKSTFKTMLAQNALSNLDSWKNELSAEHSADQLITGTQANDSETHLYGVDISDDPIWKTIGLPQNDKIAVLSTNQKNTKNSKRFIVNF